MKTPPLIAALVILSGCLMSVCPENLNLTSTHLLDYDARPDVKSMEKVLDRTVSIDGEPYTLIMYDTGTGTYYVRHEPVRSGFTRLYGPYEGDAKTVLKCS